MVELSLQLLWKIGCHPVAHLLHRNHTIRLPSKAQALRYMENTVVLYTLLRKALGIIEIGQTFL